MNYKINKLSHINIISLVCACIIPLLVTGPFLPDVIVSTLSLWFLYYSIKNKLYVVYKKFYFYAFVSFYFFSILSSLLSDDILFSIKTSLFYIRIGLFSILIFYIIEQNKKILDYFYYSFFITFSIIILDGYIQYFTGYNLVGYKLTIIESNIFRVSSFFGDELILGSYLARLFPLFFALFISRIKKNSLEIYCISILFILIDVLIFLSGERSAFFFLNLSTLFIIILIKNYQKFRLVTFLIALLFTVIITLNNQDIKNRMIMNPLKDVGLVKGSTKKNFFTPIHDSHIRTAFRMFLEKPILGHGPKLFRVKCSDPKYVVGNWPCSTHPHNFYVQLLAETGIIGFSFLFSAFCFVIYSAFRQLKSIALKQKRYLNDYQVCLLAGILISVWPFSPNGNFFNNWLSIVYTLPIGFYLHAIYEKTK